jgi:hypothetical protein
MVIRGCLARGGPAGAGDREAKVVGDGEISAVLVVEEAEPGVIPAQDADPGSRERGEDPCLQGVHADRRPHATCAGRREVWKAPCRVTQDVHRAPNLHHG